MKEVVRRRYQRAIEENAPLPDLIITDGGKGPMEVVREVIEDELNLTIPVSYTHLDVYKRQDICCHSQSSQRRNHLIHRYLM